MLQGCVLGYLLGTPCPVPSKGGAEGRGALPSHVLRLHCTAVCESKWDIN